MKISFKMYFAAAVLLALSAYLGYYVMYMIRMGSF